LLVIKMDEMDKYYQILGLNPGASEEEIKQAYRDLVKVWHPDRFVDNPRLQEKANKKLRDINDAYEKLKSYIAVETEQYRTSDGENHREPNPPPHEPPPEWEKEQSSTTESRGYEEPKPSPDEPPEVRIWNPNAAANWSILFTPAFGSYLQMLNWRTLGEPAKASSAKSWFHTSLLMWFIYTLFIYLIGMFRIDPELLYFIVWWLSVVYLITWYFATGRSQGKYVKTKFGTNYLKKSWGQALLIAVGALIGCWVVGFGLGFIFMAVTTTDNTHTAMENKLEKYRVKYESQDDLEKYRVATEPLKPSYSNSVPPQISYKKDQFSDTVTITQPELMGPKREFTRKEKAFINQHMAVYKNGAKVEGTIKHQNQDITASEYTSRAIEYLEKRDYRNAIENFNIAISLDNHLYPAYLNRGCAYYELAQYDKAIEDFNQAIVLGPDKAKAYGWCGNAYYASTFYYEAFKYYDKAIELEPNSAIYYLNRGYARLKIGDKSEAILDFKKACDLGDEDACKQLKVLGYR